MSSQQTIQRGAASITVALADGYITVHHSDGTLLLRSPSPVAGGTWSAMFDAMREQIMGADE